MYYMYESVPVGGYVIFDDVYNSPAVMQFWHDFRRDQKLPEKLVPIDSESAWFRKSKDVELDWSFFRAPRDCNKPAEDS